MYIENTHTYLYVEKFKRPEQIKIEIKSLKLRET